MADETDDQNGKNSDGADIRDARWEIRHAFRVRGSHAARLVQDARRQARQCDRGDRPNPLTGVPLGLLRSGYAADALLLDPADWAVHHVWCAGRKVR